MPNQHFKVSTTFLHGGSFWLSPIRVREAIYLPLKNLMPPKTCDQEQQKNWHNNNLIFALDKYSLSQVTKMLTAN